MKKISQQKFQNFLADAIFLTALYLLYVKLPYFQDFFGNTHHLFFSFTTLELFSWLFWGLLIVCFFLRFFSKKPKAGKSLLALRFGKKILVWLFGEKLPETKKEEKTAFLSIVVRSFYFPLMLNWCLDHLENFLGKASEALSNSGQIFHFSFFFDNYLFWVVFNLLFFVDTLIFASSYLLESEFLKNTIRSVEPTIFGWVVALMCYPPFNSITGKLISWETKDFVNDFSDFRINFVLNVLILGLLFVYVWASVALGFKSGNLVNRGIVDRGPYAFVRHPAYIAKNLAWWVGSLPALLLAWNLSWQDFLLAVVNMMLWSLIYYFRAITEERHLLADPDYQKYVKKVQWRFVPGVF